MRRLFPTTIVVVLAVAGTALAAGGPPRASGGTASTNNRGEEVKTNFNAREDKKANERGKVKLTATAPDGTLAVDYKGDVDCYFQDGNMASFSGMIVGETNGTRAEPENRFFRWVVVDGGEPSRGVDRIATGRGPVPIDCTRNNPPATDPVLRGNIQVGGGG